MRNGEPYYPKVQIIRRRGDATPGKEFNLPGDQEFLPEPVRSRCAIGGFDLENSIPLYPNYAMNPNPT